MQTHVRYKVMLDVKLGFGWFSLCCVFFVAVASRNLCSPSPNHHHYAAVSSPLSLCTAYPQQRKLDVPLDACSSLAHFVGSATLLLARESL